MYAEDLYKVLSRIFLLFTNINHRSLKVGAKIAWYLISLFSLFLIGSKLRKLIWLLLSELRK